jgi:hypothetical protein
MRGKCGTRALKNARYIQSLGPHILPREEPAAGLESVIPFDLLSRLEHATEAELQDRPDLLEFKRAHKLPVAGGNANGPLFQGTLVFVQVSFQTKTGSLVVSDADMNTMIRYISLAADTIYQYASLYGTCSIAINPTFIRYNVTLQDNTYTDIGNGQPNDLQTWVNTLVTQFGYKPPNVCLIIPNPQGVTNTKFGSNVVGYHSVTNNTPYCWVDIFGQNITVADANFLYAMQLSHEIAEMMVDPFVNGVNPEVCDPCAYNCGTLYLNYFGGLPPNAPLYLTTLVDNTPAQFPYEFYVSAIVTPGATCPPPIYACAYKPTK